MIGAYKIDPAIVHQISAQPSLKVNGGLARLSVSHLDGIVGLERCAAAIDALNAASARPNPFLSSAFLRLYALRIEYFRPGQDERLYLVWRDQELIGCAPMRLSADDFKLFKRPKSALGRRLQFLAPLDTEQPGILAARQDEEVVATVLIDHLCRHERGWGMLEFVGQRPGSALHRAVHAVTDKRFRPRDIPAAPYTEINVAWSSVGAYFQSLVKKMRSNVSRQARRLYAAGEPQLVLAEGAAAVSAWFDAYCDLDNRSWKGGSEASIQRHPRRVRFFREMAAAHGGFDPAFIGVVLDGILIAGLITGSNAGASPLHHSVWCFEMAFDQTRAELGPGQLLLLLAVGQAIEKSDEHVNFMQNFAYYKHRWAAEPIDVVNVQLLRRMSAHNLSGALGDLKRKLKAGKAGEQSAAADYDAADDAKGRARSLSEADVARAQALTASALAFQGPGIRILDRGAARDYLPFELA
jgi:hypothetical protein